MAIDPRLLFMGGQGAAGVPNIGQSLLQGLQLSQQIRRAPLMEQLDQLRVQQAQAQLQQAEKGRFEGFGNLIPTTTAEGQPGLAAAFRNPLTQEIKTVPVDLGGAELFRQDPSAQMQQRIALEQELANIEAAKQERIKQSEVETAGLKKLSEGRAQSVTTTRNSLQEKARSGTDAIKFADRGLSILKDLETGNVAKLRSELANVPGFGGLKDASAEEFQAVVVQGILSNASQLSGVLSDGDVKLLKAMGPQLSNTPEGNRRILEAMKKSAQWRQKEFRRFNKLSDKEKLTFVEDPGQMPDFLSEAFGGQKAPQQQSTGWSIVE